MIREALLRVMTEFEAARRQPFKDHPLATWMRTALPEAFTKAVPEAGQFLVVASAGKGNWVKGPWVAFFDPIITETAQEGYYVVYLFSGDMKSVSLSLNQGVTALKDEVGVKVARQVLASQAAMLAARAGDEVDERFSAEAIDLRHTGRGSLLELYEHGHAFGTTYLANALPVEDDLATDLREMLRLYRVATARGGADELPADPEPLEGAAGPEKLEERRRAFLHRRIERRAQLAKKAKEIHGHRCQVCGFDFAERYGPLGEGYIEAHHKVPLSKIPGDGAVSLSARDDFAVVCANCHRMLHRKSAPESFEEFVETFGTGQ